MELDAFTSRLGLGQGRNRPQNSTPSSGDYVFVLGDDEAGRFFNLAPGDYAEVLQDVDLTAPNLIRTNIHLRVPETLPSGFFWEVAFVIDGIIKTKATCKPGRDRFITDLTANVSKMTGIHQVGIRLQLGEV